MLSPPPMMGHWPRVTHSIFLGGGIRAKMLKRPFEASKNGGSNGTPYGAGILGGTLKI